MYIKKDGKVLWFYNSKCEKNHLLLKRKPRNVTWTGEARANKEAAKTAAKKTDAPAEAPKKGGQPKKAKAAKKGEGA